MTECFRSSDISTDSMPSLLHSFAERGIPIVKIRYYLDEIMPFKAIEKKDLTKEQDRILKKKQHKFEKTSLKSGT